MSGTASMGPLRTAVTLMLLAGVGHAGAEGWHVQGTNTLRLESYDGDGDLSASPYAFEGGQIYDEFSLNLSRRVSPYERWQGQIYGVVNGSDYRADDDGVVPERVSFSVEKGDAAVPFRAEVGDYYGYFSYRTLQRSLKGAQVELQPGLGRGGVRHSLLFTAGANQSQWRHFDADEDRTLGLSWLMDAGGAGRLNLNLLHNTRAGADDPALPERDQWLASVAGEREFAVAGHRFVAETELARLDGDHDGTADPAGGRDRQGNGIYVQVAGADPDPFSYRLRYERYDRDYRPANAVITPDRRSGEAHAGWRFDSGLELRGRLQTYRDALESDNPVDTDVAGMQLAGPLLRAAGINGTLDVYQQSIEDRAGSLDLRARTASANLSLPLPAGWSGNINALLKSEDDRGPGDNDSITRQLGLEAGHAVDLAGWRGSITPGILLRKVSGGATATVDWQPTLAFSLLRGGHSLGLSYSLLDQDPDTGLGPDTDTETLRLYYRYNRGPHTIGLEADTYARDPRAGLATDAYRVSLYWSVTFDRPPGAAAAAPRVAPAAAPATLARDPTLLTAVAPGSPVESARARLAAAGLAAATPAPGGLEIYETRLLPGIDRRQRMVLASEAGVVERAALVIELDAGPADGAAQAFEAVREQLIRIFGRPATLYEEGEFGPDPARAVNSGRLVRIMEWPTAHGVLRFGIPQLLSGRVRMELQHAAGFPAPPDNRWGLDELR